MTSPLPRRAGAAPGGSDPSGRRRRPRTVDAQRCAVLYPAIAEVARRAGADALGLIDLAGSAGLNLHVDRLGIAYDDGRFLGDPSSPVRLTASIVGKRPVPDRAVPDVVARIAVDPHPVDPADPDDARWLRACAGPEAAARLDAELAVATADPPTLLPGDDVTDAIARVPAGALPVVTTTWALSRVSPERRLRFLQRVQDAASGRPVAWVSVEGVGVAPAVPTFGDRRASGHSIIGLALADHTTLRVEGVGRCWSRGRLLSWLAGG